MLTKTEKAIRDREKRVRQELKDAEAAHKEAMAAAVEEDKKINAKLAAPEAKAEAAEKG